MSEYQYYEFVAIDGSISDEGLRYARGCSSRANVPRVRWQNTYHFGDFHGSVDTLTGARAEHRRSRSPGAYRRAEKIIRKGHEKLPVYAAGKDQSALEWQNLVGGLLDAGLLERDVQFGSLRLTAKALASCPEQTGSRLMLRSRRSPR
jgi:RQC domain-containing protein